MRKFYISFGVDSIREINANEYSLEPKSPGFAIEFDDRTITGKGTSGKGKSAVNNYYLYFRDEKNTLFYTRISPSEFAEIGKAKVFTEEFVAAAKAKAAEAPSSGPAEPADPEAPETAPVGGDPVALEARAARANAKREARKARRSRTTA